MKIKRLTKIFRPDEKAVIVAMDHGGFMPVSGLENPVRTVNTVIDGGADALIVNYGLAKKLSLELEKKVKLIVRLDGGVTSYREGKIRQLFTVKQARRVGAEGVICMGYVGSEMENPSLKNVANIAGECDQEGVPFLAEMIPQTEKFTIEEIKTAVRIGAELGADFIKAPYLGPKSEYTKVIENSFRPVLILGGKKQDRPEDIFDTVKEAMKSGAQGVCIGRNIWQSENPQRVTQKIEEIVHRK